MLSSLARDIRYAARRLCASPGFGLAGIVTIALGVGLNTGVFSILNGVFLSGLPVQAANELVDMYATVEGLDGRNEKGRVNLRFTTSEYETFRDSSATLSGLLGYSAAWPVVLGGAETREITGRYVTCNFFEVLQQPPAFGRALNSRDCDVGAEPAVLLSHNFWTRAFHADPAVVGRTIPLNGRPVTVAGIAAERAYQPELEKLQFFAPISLQPYLRPDREWLTSDTFGWLTLIGRRAPDSTIDAVRAELNVVAARIDARQQGRSTTMHVDPATVRSLETRAAGLRVVGVLLPFALVLLGACANVANLFLARATARTSETALHLSLGASRARVAVQLLSEILIVAILGGALGVLLSLAAFEAIVTAALSPLPLALPALAPDIGVLSFALALSVLAGVLAGVGPALRASGTELHATMRRDGSGREPAGGGRLQGALIAVQVGVCMVLLIAAGLLLRGLYSANRIDPGFPYEKVALITGDLRDLGYVDGALASFQRRLADEVRALPNVEAAAYVADPPWAERDLGGRVRLSAAAEPQYVPSERNHVSADYFDAVGIAIVRGRGFADDELAETSTAVVVTESTARRFWPGRDAVGRTLLMRSGRDADTALQVVGVARDAEVGRIGEIGSTYLYLPPQRDYRHMLSLVVRSRSDFASVAPELHELLRRLDVALHVQPLEANLESSRSLSAVVSGLAVSFGALTLALASIGIFGVVSYVVNRRLHEIGVRLALGATFRDVLTVILRRTMRSVVIGAVVGCAGAIAVSGLLSAVLFGVSRVDPVGIGGAAMLVLGIAVLSSALPVHRGLRADPIRSLKAE